MIQYDLLALFNKYFPCFLNDITSLSYDSNNIVNNIQLIHVMVNMMNIYSSLLFARKYMFCNFQSVYLHSSTWVAPTGHWTGIDVYNSLTKTKVPFISRNKNYVSWYMCGPTVYDSAHIGHACCYVKFDIIRRILQNFFNLNVVLVMGITDIDDKIIKRAFESKEDTRVLSSRFESEFFNDLNKLNVLPPTITVRVTDVIPNIIEFVQSLLNRGVAYRTNDGSVYFDTKEFKIYGKLCNIVPEDAQNDIFKKSVSDFALWKAAKPDEPYWHSPWGDGRPGWHIECSTIASTIFGSNVDLHTGGIDLLFPHHENEEAQSCAFHDVKQWVNYWLHSGHLHLKGNEKMSKSLKNTINIGEFLSSNSADHFRMYCLLSKYRSDVEFTEKTFEPAKAVCKKVHSFLADCDAYIKGIYCNSQIQEEFLLQNLADTREKFLLALADDFDTAKALGTLMKFISDTNCMLHAKSEGELFASRNPGVVAAASTFVQSVTNKLGLGFVNDEKFSYLKDDTSKIIDMVVDFRSEVRELVLANLKTKASSCKDNHVEILKACDKLRDGLNVHGFDIKDHGQRSSWNLKQIT